MNNLEAKVTKIISSKPKFEHNKWWINVEYDCYGLYSQTYLMFNTEESALDLKVGFIFWV
jgi:hypothetical protein